MKSSSQIAKLVIGSLAVYAGMLGCGLRGDDCENKGTCAPSDTGGVSGSGAAKGGGATKGGATSTQGGATNAGGMTAVGGVNGAGTGNSAISGGSSGTSGSGGVAGTGSGTCSTTCGGATPYCDSSADKCVACRSNGDCTDALASRCDTATGTCVACSADNDCSLIAGKGVCLTGSSKPNQCVQCTGKKYTACGQSGGKALVCDSLKNTCSTTGTAQSADLCRTCISDAQCIAGRYCLQQAFNGQPIGYYCFWKEKDPASGAPQNCALEGRPYFKAESITSVDNETGTFCTLNSTSCEALNDFLTPCSSDAQCGLGVGKDAKCAETSLGSGAFFCTMKCAADVDCKPNFSCLSGSLNYCSLTSN